MYWGQTARTISLESIDHISPAAHRDDQMPMPPSLTSKTHSPVQAK
jgi:hypothetical protein